ncbi:MAG: hypothetical protein M1821_003141 [Bathelium mastoideum]|nr:MAG: hypothetical protein M1821_003141 [Bathelium mastoideum]
MPLQPYSEESEPTNPIKSNPIKRIRWATQRQPSRKGSKKRKSIAQRLHMRGGSKEKAQHPDLEQAEGQDDQATDDGSDKAGGNSGRRVFFNIPLPDDVRDEEGHPLTHFVRNKIRTAKYTPLSFIPKNLYFQFHNIANIYFLFIVILQIFPIFGATNPGLSAVPIIVIIVITAIKDAIEDWRRTVLDNELNNAPVHRLVDWHNVNTAEEKISLWRRFKKANTRAIFFIWRWWKNRKEKKGQRERKGKTYAERALDENRRSAETRPSADSRRISIQSNYSADNHQGAIQMTPVPSPQPGQDPKAKQMNDDPFATDYEDTHSRELYAADGGAPGFKKFRGSFIDPSKQVPGKARFKKDYWKNVQVGDFVRLYNDEEIPSDMVVLSTSDPDGACYVQTKNLDGETNLKVRQALYAGRKVKHARDCERADFVVETEPPHANLYSFNGVARWKQHNPKDPGAPGTDMAEPISINNMLLRGCTLKNTEWILGIVIFTGEETKIMLNSGITPSKRAKIAKDLNWNVVYNFVILFFMCLISALVEGTTWGRPDASLQFFERGTNGEDNYSSVPALDGFITFWAAVILFQNLVPISLYISLEIIRSAQAFFIYSDTYMYYAKLDYPCTPKSWNISDDLGQIEYIFSDKTGTLTQNVMEFKKCTVNGVPYGEAYTEAQAGMQKRQGINVDEEAAKARDQIAQDRERMLVDIKRMHPNPYLKDDQLTFVAPDFISDLDGEAGDEQRTANYQFMLALALCHTVVTELTPGDPPKLEFKAQSPDEAALVATARDCGFSVLGRTQDGIILNILGSEQEFIVMNTLEFNSARKRMSAIMRMPDGKIMLFCKGADSIIYSRLKRGEQAELRKTTAEHLEMFAREGLRTLCVAQRELSEREYQAWNVKHDAAANSVENREDKLDEVADEIEQDLTLLGGTAIEDRLQDGVPDSIQLLGKAGIKLWVLTGDKVETAINIGFSCNLLDNDMDLIVLKVDDGTIENAEAMLDKHLATFNMTGSEEELRAARKNHEPPAPTHAIVIDGDALKLVLDDHLRRKFLLLCKQCRSVLCCRVSPSQKAAVVQLVKTGLDVITLSIGDGANDVAMIQEAHIGVGIAGEEGRQAVMSSDYAIGQFRFLTRLVLVHGRWSYVRLAESVANFFYKNMVWTLGLFWYQIYTNFDCSYPVDYTYILLYNLAFTSIPVILMGILDQDVNDKVSLAVPQLYRRGIERLEWTQTKFWLYMLDGTYQSVICFFMAYLVFYKANFVTFDGRDINDIKRFGAYFATPAVIVVNIYILLNTYRWDWLMVLITTISGLLIFFWTGVYASFTASFTFYETAPQIYAQPSYWAAIFLTIIIALLPRLSLKSFQKIFMPRDIDIVREQVRKGRFDYLKDADVLAPPPPEKAPDSPSSSDITNAGKLQGFPYSPDDDRRPIYPPSTAPTATTHNPRSNNNSDGTNYTTTSAAHPIPTISGGADAPPALDTSDGALGARPLNSHRDSSYSAQGWNSNRNSLVTPASAGAPRLSLDRPRPSFDRMRQSLDRVRPSFEQSRDFTSAALLTRVESSYSGVSGDERQYEQRRGSSMGPPMGDRRGSSMGPPVGDRRLSRDPTPDPMGQRKYFEPGQAL